MKRRTLSFGKRLEVYNFIKGIGKKNGDYWEYNEGWSDSLVADRCQVATSNVASVRAEHGRLRAPRSAVGISEVMNKIAELEKKVDSLEDFAKRHGWHIPARGAA